MEEDKNKCIIAMIVDDEPMARADLKQLLSEHGSIRVTSETGSIAGAIEILDNVKTDPAAEPFDVVFLDIQLQGSDGFDLLPHINTATSVIFITAHDEYAVRAFEVNALDYLLKPVSPERLARSIERLRTGALEQEKHEPESMPKLSLYDKVLVKTDRSRQFISVEEICAITSVGGNYAELYIRNGRKLLSRATIKQWETRLPKPGFIRIHRGTIVNTNRIVEIHTQSGQHLVRIEDYEEDFPASRRMIPNLKYIKETDNLS